MKLRFLLHVHACFLEKGTHNPLHGEHIICRLYDKDLVQDDLLGSATPNAHGKVHFTIDPEHYGELRSLVDKFPDLYIEVESQGEILFTTPVATDIKALEDGSFNMQEGESVDLGTFLV